MKVRALTFEEVAERNMKKMRGQISVLTQDLEASKRKNEHYKEILESTLYHKHCGFHEMCNRAGLKDYHFAFDEKKFNRFVKKIDCSPNEYFAKIIEEIGGKNDY